MINLLPRRDLAEAGESLEEGGEFRARLWLFVSFLIAAGAVAGSVAVLVSATQQKDLAGMGVGSVLQCGFILLGSIVFWAFRSGESSSSGYGYITH
ncbi:salt tolerant [Chlorella sorokiniana]|uniref:Salt tolerant n=1 Tax=Chlorella sorokiniana TaxID=3076 RepID=A0A2P6U516_CHLSO|nr:salt tolerant [Chlorella sorokiniana]|eukprot:PRW61410.1 salt tolerant [Chlorella sorokiniana]